MIDEMIGSIGSTHGVSESSRPAMKKAPTIGQNEPPRSTASMPTRWLAASPGRALAVQVEPGVTWRSTSLRVDGRAGVAGAGGASTRAEPAPPKAVSPTAAAACMRRIAEARRRRSPGW